jgi:hypothetical protein
MQKLDYLAIGSALVIFTLFAWMSNEDYKDQMAAEAHAAEIQQLAQQEAKEKKAAFNKLAKRGEELTGIEGSEQ